MRQKNVRMGKYVLASIVASLCATGPMAANAQNLQGREMNVVSWGGAWTEASRVNFFEPFEKETGVKINVIPARSQAFLDCRLLPGQDPEAWRQQVIDFIDDDRIQVEFARQTSGRLPKPAEWDTELFWTINAVVKEAMEEAVVVPAMTVGATDNRFLRDRGIPAYGFIPCLLSPEERRGFHGNNEFLTIDNLNMGCELMYEIVRRMVV